MNDVQIRLSGACGRITLNRPAAMNALTTPMVQAIHTALTAWANNDAVAFVLVDGAGERGFCAGGDIRALYTATISGHRDQAVDFFRNEYHLTYLIARYPKPYVVLMDGIVMGGGVGISSHGSHRIVTERTRLAMPETAIGFVPDVGGTYLLAKAPAEFGTYLALTGDRVDASGAISSGLADLIIPSSKLSSLTHDLETCDDAAKLDERLHTYAFSPAQSAPDSQPWIKECFAFDTIEEIFAALAAHPHPDSKLALHELHKRSPTSLKVTLAALRNGRRWNDLAPCLQQEFRIAQTCLQEHDFIEGIRAAIIDKDRNPIWKPARLEDISPIDVQRYFAASGQPALNLVSAPL